jgi:hypothetical protein
MQIPRHRKLISLSGNQQDVLIVLIRQTQRAQEDAKGTGVYIQNEARKPHKPLQGLDKNPGQYWTEPLIDTMTEPRLRDAVDVPSARPESKQPAGPSWQ